MEDRPRPLRKHAGDLALTIRLNGQYASMVRTPLSTNARLMPVQAVRHRRHSVEATATVDAEGDPAEYPRVTAASPRWNPKIVKRPML
jgi:hypothetical protein